jgi:hypothetical protein
VEPGAKRLHAGRLEESVKYSEMMKNEEEAKDGLMDRVGVCEDDADLLRSSVQVRAYLSDCSESLSESLLGDAPEVQFGGVAVF